MNPNDDMPKLSERLGALADLYEAAGMPALGTTRWDEPDDWLRDLAWAAQCLEAHAATVAEDVARILNAYEKDTAAFDALRASGMRRLPEAAVYARMLACVVSLAAEEFDLHSASLAIDEAEDPNWEPGDDDRQAAAEAAILGKPSREKATWRSVPAGRQVGDAVV